MGRGAHSGKPEIVVLGAGFGGMAFCRSFAGDGRITLVDRQNHHLFQPLLYQVAMSGLSATEVAEPVRAVFRRRPELTVLMARVLAVDLGRRRVELADRSLDYDALVLALGGRTSWFGNERFARHSLGLKTLDDALAIRRRILSSFEKAEGTSEPDELRRLMTIVIVGGGPTGVELAGTMVDLSRRVFSRDFRNIDPRAARVILVEAGDRLLPAFDERLSRSAAEQLEGLGVELRLGVQVADVGPGRVVLGAGEVVETRNVLWAAGVAANAVTSTLGVPLDRRGRVLVEPDLTVPGHPEVFAIGDIAALVDRAGQPVPGLAPAAIQGGQHVAERLARRFRGDDRPGKPFLYRDRGMMASIGRRRAVAQLKGLRLTGVSAWLAWAVVHLFFLITFRNRLFVLLSWAYAYFTYRHGARIIHGADPAADERLVDETRRRRPRGRPRPEAAAAGP